MWAVRDFFEIPANLSKCTQDCDIEGFIKIRHKLKFAVSLRNPDGHISELRASLPITLFISPNVAVTSGGEEVGTFGAVGTVDADANAPPRYDDHIYDRLWQDIHTSGMNTPLTSGANTPHIRSRRNSGENADALGFTALDTQRAQLHAGLSALALSQSQAAASGASSSTSLSANVSAANQGAIDSYFPPRSGSGNVTPGMLTPTSNFGDDSYNMDMPTNMHLSHLASPLESPTANLSESEDRPEPDLGTLSKVPSYSTALRTPVRESDSWLPSYDDEDGLSSPGMGSARSSGPSSRSSTPPISRNSSSHRLSSLTSGTSHSNNTQTGGGNSSGLSSGHRSRPHFFSMK